MNDITITERQADVLEGIRAGKMLRDISRDLGLSRQRISQVVGQLIDAGLVIEPRRAHYLTTDEPHRYQMTPVVVDAVRFTGGDSGTLIIMWAAASEVTIKRVFGEETPKVTGLDIHTPEGPERVEVGDWIVAKKNGFSRIDVETFSKLYEAVPDES